MSSHQKTVYELLQAQLADPTVARLLQQLDKLSARCSLVHRAADAHQAAAALNPGSSPSVHAVELPDLSDAAAQLPPFAWAACSEHGALQAAVEEASGALQAESARYVWEGNDCLPSAG